MGRELWKSDGTVSGTMMVADVNTGNSAPNAWPMVFSGGTVYFTADDGIHGNEPLKTDGTALNTTMVIASQARLAMALPLEEWLSLMGHFSSVGQQVTTMELV